MIEPIDETRFRALVPGYVDGELASADRLAVAEYLAAHPAAAVAIADQERLRAAVSRIVMPAVPADLSGLRSAIAEPPPARMQIFTPWRSALAACLILAGGVSIGTHLHARQSSGVVAGNAGPFSAVLVNGLMRTHVHCSRFIVHVNLAAREAAGPLPAPLQQFENGHPGVPDFTSFGYRFEGADPCPVPGGLTMHLLYRADGSKSDEKKDDTISLFVQMDAGQVKIDADKLYTAADANSPHPILLWRSGGLVYYLVGDSMDTVENAERAVRTRGVAWINSNDETRNSNQCPKLECSNVRNKLLATYAFW